MKLHRSIPVWIFAVAIVAILSGCGSSAKSTNPAAALDTTPPPAVTGLAVMEIPGSGVAYLIWDASPAADVAGYEVYSADNGYALIGTTGHSPYNLGATAQGATFAVRAVDASGNASAYAVVSGL